MFLLIIIRCLRSIKSKKQKILDSLHVSFSCWFRIYDEDASADNIEFLSFRRRMMTHDTDTHINDFIFMNNNSLRFRMSFLYFGGFFLLKEVFDDEEKLSLLLHLRRVFRAIPNFLKLKN